MTSFKIHTDEDTQSTVSYHNDHKTSKRHVLGDIQNNISRPFASLKRGLAGESSNIVHSGFLEKAEGNIKAAIENIKALGIKDKLKDVPCGNFVSRSPLKNLHDELKRKLDTNSNGILISKESDDKENIGNISDVSCSSIAENCEKKFLEDEVTNCAFQNNSVNSEIKHVPDSLDNKDSMPACINENSVECVTPQVSRLELSRSILDDIYSNIHYKEDIFKYLQELEKKFQPSAYYMRRQPQITHSMRTILVDWLVEVGEEYKLSNETLFLAVSLTDRFLSFMAITKAKLQLLGTAAMMAASKFEEIYPPEAGAFVYITDDSYTISQLIRMERLLLKVLNFDVSSPTIYSFLTLIFSCEKVMTKIFYLAMYIAELSLLEAEPYLEFLPSLIASGCVVLSRHCLDCKDIWPASHLKLTGYSLTQLVPVINHLNETHCNSFTSTHQAIRQKYNEPKFRCVSQVPFRRLTLRES